ncbi:rpo operon protein [Natronomonas sp. F2-12]|uniref:Rpo operon protein n=1 Tax=Natronomonas aquatica TaxID=2841590 RepID=A0A9R1CV49_9EURY|nr:rpo operon protein [Natronomonas aquatica]
MHTVELDFRYDTPEAAALVADAVGEELGEIDGDRATATLAREGSRLSIGIDAEDLVALRAGVNTWSTLVEVAETVAETGNHDRRDTDHHG